MDTMSGQFENKSSWRGRKERLEKHAHSSFAKPWNCITRIDAVDPELLRTMADHGCYCIGYGVETGSPRTLERLGKWCRRRGVDVDPDLTRLRRAIVDIGEEDLADGSE